MQKFESDMQGEQYARFCHHCIISLQFAVYREKINELDHALQSSTEQTVQSDAEALEVAPYYHEDIRGLITVVVFRLF